ELITGEPGQKITLGVRHEDGETEDIPLVRAEIKVSTVLGDKRKSDNIKEWDFLYDKENRIGYVRLAEFTETSTKEMKAALEELKKLDVKGIVLDLRGNPGGLLRSAKEISNLFLDDGKIVSTRGRDGDEEVFEANPRDTVFGPDSGVGLAVLINR